MPKFKNIDLTARRVTSRVLNDINFKRTQARYRSDTDPEYVAEALKLLTRAGIPFDSTVSPREKGVHWDGSMLAIKGQDASNLLHELAHYQVAPPAFRDVAEFGIGRGPDASYKKDCPYEDAIDSRPAMTAEQKYRLPWGSMAILEECRASFLGVLWERALGGTWRDTAHSHNWVNSKAEHPKDPNYIWWQWENGAEDQQQYTKWLLEQGLIDGHGNPKLSFRKTNHD